MTAVTLDGGVCTVRSFRPDDAALLPAVANEREIWINLRDRFPHPYRLEHAEAFIEHCRSQDVQTNFCICLDDKPVGGIGLTLGTDIERVNAEIGYWLGKRYWGRGIVTGALQAVTRHAITQFGLTRVFAIPFVDNVGSIRVLEKAGFVREGLMKRSAIKDGVVRDQYLYAFYA